MASQAIALGALAAGFAAASAMAKPQGITVFKLNPKYAGSIFDKVPVNKDTAAAARKKNQPRDLSGLEDLATLIKKVPKKD
eukprot:CAMPEP_0184654296 /NCGR_PEP_ID=MMETSP0308-20130426/11994_1 /TAXON_ID=38269 /ORGANISM="Gloeochaete witrockiana, Strain SAG 46.84" /LENGTH=80 /DNA_ID=CAMNT_0027090231 /DNA_START=111 /DNA_END=353 /DNA_ORIENTATION=+